MTFKISGTGCSLMDHLYTEVDFSSAGFKDLLSQEAGDGGLAPGALVFADNLERFSGRSLVEAIDTVVGDRTPDCSNLGGPAIVALISASQLLHDRDVQFEFYAGRGDDDTGRVIIDIVSKTQVGIDNYRVVAGATPATTVLSDPSYHDGKGERTFINKIGAAGNYQPEYLDEDFYAADVLFFGATALVPHIHDHLTALLRRGRENGCVNVVTTVYDFRNEERFAGVPWPLGEGDSFPFIDLLIMDAEEALKISGETTIVSAVDFFIAAGVGSVIVTHGSKAVHLASSGGVFTAKAAMTLPVSDAVNRDLDKPDRPHGDTTGCGDNFAGGVLSSLIDQMLGGKQSGLDLVEACAWGACSGGCACFYAGGTRLESSPGENEATVKAYYREYCDQIGATCHG